MPLLVNMNNEVNFVNNKRKSKVVTLYNSFHCFRLGFICLGLEKILPSLVINYDFFFITLFCLDWSGLKNKLTRNGRRKRLCSKYNVKRKVELYFSVWNQCEPKPDGLRIPLLKSKPLNKSFILLGL